MINERIEIWKKEEYHYPAAHGFIPVMFSYIHEDEKKHPAMIIAPGGAYREVSPSEAHLPAMEFYGAGYNVFVLEYTINQLDEAPLKMQPLHDISRAIRMIRSRAEEFHIRPDRIAVCGFSAGAHLCGSLSDLAFPVSDHFSYSLQYHLLLPNPTPHHLDISILFSEYLSVSIYFLLQIRH